jgi:hypothetical protein
MISRLSDYFKIDHERIDSLGAFDAFTDIDSRLFLDPYLLKYTEIPEFRNSREKIIKYYSNIITLLASSNRIGDPAWMVARRMLIFRELKGISMGYGNKSSDGSGVGPELGLELINRADEIIKMGIKDPEIFELVGLFEEGFGADRLSDMTINIIRDDIFSYSERVAKELQIQDLVEYKTKDRTYRIPPSQTRRKLIFFLPKELLRPLPVALSWDEIGYASQVNQEIRDRLNKLIAETWSKKNSTKEERRKIIFTNPKNLELLVTAYKNVKAEKYDYDKDAGREVMWYSWGKQIAEDNKIQLTLGINPTIEEVEKIVSQIIYQFKKNIEFNGANRFLYIDKNGKLLPARERFSQLLFFCIADSYCHANNLDLSPEVNSGNGSIDFKISRGYLLRILTEIKLSSNNRLYDGYFKQVKAYEESESTNKSFYVVIRVTNSIKQIKKLQTSYELLKKDGKKVPSLVIIDGLIKKSASRR